MSNVFSFTRKISLIVFFAADVIVNTSSLDFDLNLSLRTMF